eukprot:m51a1_g7585 putative cathepsin b precursor (515) ;mRNA; r:200820-202930
MNKTVAYIAAGAGCLCCVVVVLVIALPIALVDHHTAELPDIPCTLTATVNTTLQLPNAPLRWSLSTIYIDDYDYAQIQLNQTTYGKSSGSTKTTGYVLFFEDLFFGRRICTMMWYYKTRQCISVNGLYSQTCRKCACPLDATRRCDTWTARSGQKKYVVVVDSQTHVPVQRVFSSPDKVQTLNFLSVSLDPIDPSVFSWSNTDTCTDLRWVGIPRLSSTRINDEEEIAAINRVSRTWTAGKNGFFDDKTFDDVKEMLRQPEQSVLWRPRESPLPTRPAREAEQLGAIPRSFDARQQWPACGMDYIRNQDTCGGCWAFAGSKAFEDRYCVAHGAVVRMGPIYPISCHMRQQACQGGFVDLLWQDYMTLGTATDACVPTYSIVSSIRCPTRCPSDGSSLKLYRTTSAYDVHVSGNRSGTVEMMQREIMTYGPLEVTFYVFSDFMHYTSGVYRVTEGSKYSGAHAVVIVGWGEDSAGVPYWIVANSWGDWGLNGFFYIRRGFNEAGIEEQVATGRVA